MKSKGRIGLILFLMLASAALEILAVLAIAFERTVWVVTGSGPCGDTCWRWTLEGTPTHPYFVAGLLSATAGTILAAFAIFMWRSRKRARAIGVRS